MILTFWISLLLEGSLDALISAFALSLECIGSIGIHFLSAWMAVEINTKAVTIATTFIVSPYVHFYRCNDSKIVEWAD